MKNRLACLAAATTLFSAVPATSHASVIYNYTGQAFTVVDSWLYTNHNLLGNTNTFSFTFDNALAANLNLQDVSSLVTAWDASALNTPKSEIGSTVLNSVINSLKFSTDVAGNITNWSIDLTGYTNDIYGNDVHGNPILGAEKFSSSLTTEALTFMNPPGYTSWLSGSRGGAYGLAYCFGPSCFDATPGSWQKTVIAPTTGGGGSTVPEPTTLALLGLSLTGLSLTRRRSPSRSPKGVIL